MASLVALQGNAPQFDTMGSFAQGAQARQTFDDNQITLARKGLENIGSIALGAMGGKLDGQVNPEQFEMGLDLLEQNGLDVKSFRGRPEIAPIAARASMDALKQLQVASDERSFDLAMKKFQADMAAASKGPAPTDDQREYDMAVSQGYKGSFMDYMGEIKKAGSSSTTINMPGGGDGAFFDELDKADGEVFAGLLKEAPTVGRKAVQIDQLEGLLGNINTGGLAGLQQMAGEFGINTEGLDGIQAAQALINQIVPEQRQPGSGPMSDADLLLFKQSVPRIINQPGGNQVIIDTMRGINEYTRAQSAIAAKLASRQITRDQARAELASLPNPLEGYAQKIAAAPAGTAVPAPGATTAPVIGSPGGGAPQPGSPGGEADWTDYFGDLQ
jgi:hypothetical protein